MQTAPQVVRETPFPPSESLLLLLRICAEGENGNHRQSLSRMTRLIGSIDWHERRAGKGKTSGRKFRILRFTFRTLNLKPTIWIPS